MGEISGSFRQFALSRPVIRRATAMAFIAGPVIVFINHGDLIVSGKLTQMEWVKIGITFLVPYGVPTISSVLAVKHPPQTCRERLTPGSDQQDCGRFATLKHLG